MGWIVDYLKLMWNQGADKGKQSKEKDIEKLEKLKKKLKGNKK